MSSKDESSTVHQILREGMKSIRRHIVFTAAGIGLTFVGLSLLRSENNKWQNRSMKQRVTDAFKKLQQQKTGILGDLRHQWDLQSQGQKLALALIGVNAAIFGLWQIPSLSRFMHRYFLHDPASGRVLTMWTSAYSHHSLLHLGFNMYALYGFLPLLQSQSGMSWEQTLAFYNSAALISSLASHIGGILLSRYRIIIPSLGASGAIWAVLAGSAIVAPYLKVGIIFLPGKQDK